MDARASAKYLRGSAQKARLVVDMIRGKNVNEALAVLQYTNKRAADGIGIEAQRIVGQVLQRVGFMCGHGIS